MRAHDLILTRPAGLPLVRAGSYKLITVILGLLAALLLGEILLRVILPLLKIVFMCGRLISSLCFIRIRIICRGDW